MIKCNDGFDYEFSVDYLTNMGKEDDAINTLGLSCVARKRKKQGTSSQTREFLSTYKNAFLHMHIKINCHKNIKHHASLIFHILITKLKSQEIIYTCIHDSSTNVCNNKT